MGLSSLARRAGGQTNKLARAVSGAPLLGVAAAGGFGYIAGDMKAQVVSPKNGPGGGWLFLAALVALPICAVAYVKLRKRDGV